MGQLPLKALSSRRDRAGSRQANWAVIECEPDLLTELLTQVKEAKWLINKEKRKITFKISFFFHLGSG